MITSRLHPFGPEIWLADGGEAHVAGFRYPTRMSVVRLTGGGLLVWSPVGLDDDLAAEADPAGFDVSDVKEALGVDDDADLRGVWGGITKRVRTVLGDDEAYLIWWTERENGGWTGRVSAMTHRSFGKVLGL